MAMLDDRLVLRIPHNALLLVGLLLVGLLLVGLVALAACDGSGQSVIERPNLLLIVSDDLGYGELSIQGSEGVDTPRIGGLAPEGMRFTNAYVSAPICARARAPDYWTLPATLSLCALHGQVSGAN